MKVSRLFIYPVKSLGGMEVKEAEIDELGFVGDRRFMVVDHNGVFLTQRTVPRMALIATLLRGDTLLLRQGNGSAIEVSRVCDPGAELVKVVIWKSRDLLAEYCGDDAATWLSSFLGFNCRLVRIGPAFRRVVSGSDQDRVSFADGQPGLVISEASLELLNGKLTESGGCPSTRARGPEPGRTGKTPALQGARLDWDRFRPNLVVNGCSAHEEDTWTRIRIGETVWRADGPCARCPITTTDQKTAERGHEPLKTLATYRRDADEPGAVNFGQNLINETKSGVIRVGDAAAVVGG